MKTNFKQNVCTFIALFTLVTGGSLFAKDKTAGEKLDKAIDKTEKAAESVKDKAKETAHDVKEKTKETVEKGKEKGKELAKDTQDKMNEQFDKVQ